MFTFSREERLAEFDLIIEFLLDETFVISRTKKRSLCMKLLSEADARTLTFDQLFNLIDFECGLWMVELDITAVA